jgi:hypothetical protein
MKDYMKKLLWLNPLTKFTKAESTIALVSIVFLSANVLFSLGYLLMLLMFL